MPSELSRARLNIFSVMLYISYDSNIVIFCCTSYGLFFNFINTTICEFKLIKNRFYIFVSKFTASIGLIVSEFKILWQRFSCFRGVCRIVSHLRAEGGRGGLSRENWEGGILERLRLKHTSYALGIEICNVRCNAFLTLHHYCLCKKMCYLVS